VDLVERFCQDDVDAARGGFSEEDAQRFAEDLDVSFVARLGQEPRGDYAGLDGFVEGWRDWLTPWASYVAEAEDFIDAGDSVVVFIRVHARTSHDDVGMEHQPAALWTVKDGRVVAIGMYLERGDALAAAGLSGRGDESRAR
jgi:ketosteroid isomerase-like protein